jgi:hypothetical protein
MKELVKKFGLNDYNTNKILMATNAKLCVDEGRKPTYIH